MTGRSVMNIPVPDVGFTDLGNSYAVFRVQPSVTDTGGASRIYPMVFADPTHAAGGSDTQYTPCTAQALIRNTKATYDKAPQVQNEWIQQNVYNQNVDWYLNTRGNQDSMCVLDADATYNYGTIAGSGLPNTPFIQYSRPSLLPAAGTTTYNVMSQMRNPDMRIPMKHLDQLADGIHQFPMTAFGNTNYYVQLENVINVVSPAQMPQNIGCQNLTTATTAFIGDANNPIYLTETYTTNARLKDIPIYVGAPLNITTTYAAGTHNGTGVVTTITLQSNGTVGFTITPPIAAGGTGVAVTLISFSYQGYDALAAGSAGTYDYPSPANIAHAGGAFNGISASWQITNAWVELHELKLMPDQLKAAQEGLRNLEIPYLEVRTVQKNMLSTTTEYSDTNPFDPGCVALAILTPQSNTLTSGFDSAGQYRHKVNTKDVEGRWVIVGPEQETNARLSAGRQYHNYLLQFFFNNLGKPLKKFDAPAFNYTAYNDTNTHAMYPLVINDGETNGTVGINIQAATGGTMQQKVVFWQWIYRKALLIKNGQVVG